MAAPGIVGQAPSIDDFEEIENSDGSAPPPPRTRGRRRGPRDGTGRTTQTLGIMPKERMCALALAVLDSSLVAKPDTIATAARKMSSMMCHAYARTLTALVGGQPPRRWLKNSNSQNGLPGLTVLYRARSILNATTGHSNSGSLGVDFETDESNLACVYAYASRHRAIVIVLTSSLIDDVQRESRCVSPCPRGRTSNESSYVRLYLRSLPGRNSYLF